MTLVGDSDVVGVELAEGPSGFGGMRLWLNGHPIGGPELYGTVGALAEGLARFRSRANERVSPKFFLESARWCLDTVQDALFGPSEDLKSSVSSAQQYGAFLLSPNLCESLDGYLIVVVSDGHEQRIIARSYVDGAAVEVRAPQGTIEHVFEAAEAALVAVLE